MGKSRHSSERRHRDDDEDNRHRRDRKSRRESDGKDEDVSGSRRRKDRSVSEDDSRRNKRKHHQSRSEDEERRRQKKKHSRRDDEDDASEDSRRHRKRHSHDEEDRKRRKRTHRKEDDSSEEDDRHKDKKRHKEDRKKKKKSSKKEDRKSKKVDKSSLVSLGENVGTPPVTLIDPEKDYFTYHQHLWVFLFREEGAAFNDLTSEEARAAFQRFSERYNGGHLETAYYDPKGLPQEVLEECKTTRHSWSFQTNETERKGLKLLQKGVRRQTEYDAPPDSNEPSTKADVGNAAMKGRDKAVIAPRRKTPEEQLADRQTNKRLRGQVRAAEEEMVGGRKEGRERQIEKRQEGASRIHAAAKDREEARAGGVELTDGAIYGGDGSNFQSALSRERQRKAQRGDKQKSRMEELQKKEQERQENMLKMLGLTGVKPGQKITIAPRKDV